VLLYVSIYPLFALAPFVLRRREELRALALALAAVILGGGVGFVLLPAEAAFPPPGHAGCWQELYTLARQLARRYNMVPSLHVALGVTCVAVYAPRARWTVAALLWIWAVGIAVSTLLTHQHHLLDVATGWLLGWAGGWLCRRCQRPTPAASERQEGAGAGTAGLCQDIGPRV
jgi:membrane-associated phospholipid phosphatase